MEKRVGVMTGEPDRNLAAPPAAQPSEFRTEVPSAQLFQHDGRAGELFAITLVNLFLKVVTLGVYHFWAKTRVRRYLWSHTSFAGERFEYTGRGGELFRGFVLAIGALVLLAALGIGLRVILGAIFPRNAFLTFAFTVLVLPAGALLFLFLLGFARYSARRYRLSRTRWRGIRFGLSGSAVSHGKKMVGYSLLLALTLGFYWPYMRNHLTANFLNNSWFGNQRLFYHGKGGALFGRYFGSGFLLGIFGGLVSAFLNPLQESLIEALAAKEGVAGEFLIPVLGVVFGVASLAPFIIIWAWYTAGEYRYFASRAKLGPLRVHTSFATRQFIWLRLSNFLLLVFTLGLAFPWVAVRTVRFACDHVRLEGELDFEAIAQSTQERPTSGEGLAEAFDLDLF